MKPPLIHLIKYGDYLVSVFNKPCVYNPACDVTSTSGNRRHATPPPHPPPGLAVSSLSRLPVLVRHRRGLSRR